MARLPDPKPKWPKPQKDEWDSDDSPVLEYGTIEELKGQLISLLEEQLQELKEETPEPLWALESPTWPYTRMGLRLLKGIQIADAIVKQLEHD